MKILIVVLFITMAPSIGFSQEIIAKTRTWSWLISVRSEGTPSKESCRLELVAEGFRGKNAINIKRKGINCGLYGPVRIYASEAWDRKSTIVLLEAMRGGDGDHTGPVVEAFRLSHLGFMKLGEAEIFDATYHIKDGQILYVTGHISFSLQMQSPAWPNMEDSIAVPVVMTLGARSVWLRPTISKKERELLVQKFEAKTAALLEGHDDEFTSTYIKPHIDNIRKYLKGFLER